MGPSHSPFEFFHHPKIVQLSIRSIMQLKQTLPIALTAALAYAQDGSDSGSGSSGMMNLTALLSSTDSLSSLNDLVGNYPDFAAALASREDATILAPTHHLRRRTRPLLAAMATTLSVLPPQPRRFHSRLASPHPPLSSRIS